MIDTRDQARIVAALESWPEQQGFVGYRTRAFVYLLWDGALRTGTAVALDLEQVASCSAHHRIRVRKQAILDAGEGSSSEARVFEMTVRTRGALADYLRIARNDGWLGGKSLKGPLWIATQPRGAQKRMSQRTAVQAWHMFIGSVKGLSREDLQLDDVVLTGRVAFAEAANSSSVLISAHAGIGAKAAARYSGRVSTQSRTRDVISQLNEQHMQTFLSARLQPIR